MKLKNIIGIVGFLTITHSAMGKDVYVKGHYNQNGTFVQPHFRTAQNANPYDNYSTKGNYNPHTGKEGTKNPYSSYGSDYDYSKSQRSRGW